MREKEKLLSAINYRLFQSATVKALFNSKMNYARGPVDGVWPQLVYFDVTGTQGYIADFNSMTVQFSVWSRTAINALQLISEVDQLFRRFGGAISNGTDSVFVSYTELIDSGALPQDDPILFGQYLRYRFRYRGENLGG